jgi:hypothetical protein
MTVMNTIVRSGLAAARDLRAVMQGKVALLGDGAYTRARRIWNGAVDHHPALFALCEVPGGRPGGRARCPRTRASPIGAGRRT